MGYEKQEGEVMGTEVIFNKDDIVLCVRDTDSTGHLTKDAFYVVESFVHPYVTLKEDNKPFGSKTWYADRFVLPAPADPVRVQILKEGAKLTNGQRDAEYGPPSINMKASGALKRVAREVATREITDAEWEALDMVLTKFGRVLTGTPKRDTYVDMATYSAIAGEISGA